MALPDSLKISALTSVSTGVSSQTVANGASYESSTVINNTTNRYSLMAIEAVWSYSTAPTGNKTVEVYLLKSLDGTNFESLTGGDPVRPIVSFSPPAVTTTRRLVLIQDLPLVAGKYKLAVKNVDTGQTITITLNAYMYDQTTED